MFISVVFSVPILINCMIMVVSEQLFEIPVSNLTNPYAYSAIYHAHDLSGQLALSVQSINDIPETGSVAGPAGQKSPVGRSRGDERRENDPTEARVKSSGGLVITRGGMRECRMCYLI